VRRLTPRGICKGAGIAHHVRSQTAPAQRVHRAAGGELEERLRAWETCSGRRRSTERAARAGRSLVAQLVKVEHVHEAVRARGGEQGSLL